MRWNEPSCLLYVARRTVSTIVSEASFKQIGQPFMHFLAFLAILAIHHPANLSINPCERNWDALRRGDSTGMPFGLRDCFSLNAMETTSYVLSDTFSEKWVCLFIQRVLYCDDLCWQKTSVQGMHPDKNPAMFGDKETRLT